MSEGLPSMGVTSLSTLSATPRATANADVLKTLRWLKAQAQSGTGDAYVTDAYRSGSSWYRVWSNGLIEQGGSKPLPGQGTKISLVRSYSSSSSYQVVVSKYSSTADTSWDPAQGPLHASNKSTSSFYVNTHVDCGSGFSCQWYAFGY